MQAKCTSTKERPIARPAKLFVAPLVFAVAPNTTNTNTKVKNISAKKPPNTVTFVPAPSNDCKSFAPVPTRPAADVSK